MNVSNIIIEKKIKIYINKCILSLKTIISMLLGFIFVKFMFFQCNSFTSYPSLIV